MPDPTTLELITKHIDAGFARLDRRADDIVEQMRIMNGKVADGHIKIAVHTNRLDDHAGDISLLRERTHKLHNELQAVDGRALHSLKLYVAIGAGSIGSLLALMRLFGKL